MAGHCRADGRAVAGVSPALTILCRRPGFRRAGLAHPARAEYPAGAFTAEQMAALTEEPLLQLLPAEMPGQTEGEGPLAPVDPSAVSAAAPAAAPEAEPIKEAKEGPVSSEGQAATPGDAAAVADEAAVDGKAGEAAGASNAAARAPRRSGRAKA